MKSGTMADADIPLGNGTICLCLAPVYHIGSEIEKRKNAQARPENEKSSTQPPSVPLRISASDNTATLTLKPSSGASHL